MMARICAVKTVRGQSAWRERPINLGESCRTVNSHPEMQVWPSDLSLVAGRRVYMDT